MTGFTNLPEETEDEGEADDGNVPPTPSLLLALPSLLTDLHCAPCSGPLKLYYQIWLTDAPGYMSALERANLFQTVAVPRVPDWIGA